MTSSQPSQSSDGQQTMADNGTMLPMTVVESVFNAARTGNLAALKVSQTGLSDIIIVIFLVSTRTGDGWFVFAESESTNSRVLFVYCNFSVTTYGVSVSCASAVLHINFAEVFRAHSAADVLENDKYLPCADHW